MSNLNKFLQAKHDYTAKTSDVNRSLAFAGIAVVWIFKDFGQSQDQPQTILPSFLLWPLFLFMLSLALDLFQYAIASLIWTMFYRRSEKNIQKGFINDTDIGASRWNYRIIDAFFWLKITSLLAGYFLLLSELLEMI